MTAGHRFQILALSGGGYRGLYTAAVLKELEAAAGKPLADTFDLIAGTSVGGILALALAAGHSASEILEIFRVDGGKVFPTSSAPFFGIKRLTQLIHELKAPRYDTTGLQNITSRLIGENTRVSDLRCPILIPAVDVTSGRPICFTEESTDEEQQSLKATDIAEATSAAPFLFPLARVSSGLHADGGLFATAPDLLAWQRATHISSAAESDVHILSVGTMTANFTIADCKNGHFGILDWLRGNRLLWAFNASQQQSVTELLQSRLGERFIRIDAHQSSALQKQYGLDVVTEAITDQLIQAGVTSAQQSGQDEKVKRILAHQPARSR